MQDDVVNFRFGRTTRFLYYKQRYQVRYYGASVRRIAGRLMSALGSPGKRCDVRAVVDDLALQVVLVHVGLIHLAIADVADTGEKQQQRK